VNIHKRFHHSLVIIAAATLVAACSDSSRPASPLSPSPLGDVLPASNGGTPPVAPPAPSGSSSTSGARVTGVVDGGGGMTVTVVGTNISTTVDSSGNFTINGVPPGDVELRFSAGGVDVALALTAVSDQEQIEISVTMNGANALVTSQQRKSTDNRIELRGLVSNLSGSCPAITFTVNGQSVTTSAATVFEDGTCGSVQNGTRVEVKGNTTTERQRPGDEGRHRSPGHRRRGEGCCRRSRRNMPEHHV
jgi:hypothetical protein